MPPQSDSPEDSRFPTMTDTNQPVNPNQNQPTPAAQSPTSKTVNPSEPPVATSLPPLMAQSPAAPTSTPLSPKPRNSTKLILKMLVIILLVTPIAAFGAGLALAYNNYAFYTPPKFVQNVLDTVIATTPLPKPSRIILNSAIAKSATLTSADIKTEFLISSDAKNAPFSSVKLSIAGPVDFSQTQSRAAEADVSLGVKFEGAEFNGSASVKTIDDIIYFKLNEVPFGQLYQQLLDYKGKWYFYKIPPEYLPKDKKAQTQQDLNKIQQVVSDFVQKTESWTSVKSTDGDSYTLEIKPPKPEINKLIFNLVDALEPKDQKQIVSDLEKEQLKKFTDKLKDLSITAKVNKANYFLKMADISFNINVSDLNIPTATDKLLPTESLIYKFNISAELSNYNKKIIIVPPAGGEDFQKIIDRYSKQTSQYLNQNGQAMDSAIKNDIGTLATELQIYHNSKDKGFYPMDLDELVKNGTVKTVPKPPVASGIDSYLYIKDPTVCDGTATNPCRDVALFAPLASPEKIGNGWCWQSISPDLAKELPKDQCMATKAQSTQDNSLRGLISPDQTVLGQKVDWENQLMQFFSSILN